MKLRQSSGPRPCNDSERSPSVYYANWKEEMLLEKQVSTLNRTERGLLHRITVNQKVIFRRFHTKLQRSKIAHARMYGDKESEQELRRRDMRRLHSESHLCGEGEDEFLGKLKQRPFDGETTGRPKGKGKETGRLPLPELVVQDDPEEVTDKDMTSLIQAVMNEQPVPITAHSRRSLSTLGCLLDATRAPNQPLTPLGDGGVVGRDKLRPATTIASGEDGLSLSETEREQKMAGVLTRADNDGVCKDNQNSLSTDECRNSAEKEDDKMKCPPGTDQEDRMTSGRNNDAGTSEESSVHPSDPVSSTDSVNSLMMNLTVDDHESSHADERILKPREMSGKSLVRRRKRMRRSHVNFASDSSDEVTTIEVVQPSSMPPLKPPSFTQRRVSSVFEEVKRPDYCQMRLDKARAVDHSQVVRAFCDRLSDLGQSTPNFDYYATNMQAAAARQVKVIEVPCSPASPSDDYRRHTGDQTVPCITLKTVHMISSKKKGDHNDGGGGGDDDDGNDSEVYEHQWMDLFEERQGTPRSDSELSTPGASLV